MDFWPLRNYSFLLVTLTEVITNEGITNA